MADRYITAEGDMVDEICWRYYTPGQFDGATESVLTENYGLADYGDKLPAGVEIVLPDRPEPEGQTFIRIWGEE